MWVGEHEGEGGGGRGRAQVRMHQPSLTSILRMKSLAASLMFSNCGLDSVYLPFLTACSTSLSRWPLKAAQPARGGAGMGRGVWMVSCAHQEIDRKGGGEERREEGGGGRLLTRRATEQHIRDYPEAPAVARIRVPGGAVCTQQHLRSYVVRRAHLAWFQAQNT